VLKPGPPAMEKRYRIGHVAKTLGVQPYVLRFWEQEFPQAAPARTPKGQRYYTEEHVRMFQRIQHLLYVEKMTIKGARQRLEEKQVLHTSLNFIRQELVEIQELLQKSAVDMAGCHKQVPK